MRPPARLSLQGCRCFSAQSRIAGRLETDSKGHGWKCFTIISLPPASSAQVVSPPPPCKPRALVLLHKWKENPGIIGQHGGSWFVHFLHAQTVAVHLQCLRPRCRKAAPLLRIHWWVTQSAVTLQATLRKKVSSVAHKSVVALPVEVTRVFSVFVLSGLCWQ